MIEVSVEELQKAVESQHNCRASLQTILPNLLHTRRGGAVLSPCGSYRYSLTRPLDGRGKCVFVMLNPSTADAEQDDPTIRRCIGFAQGWGFGELEVVNLFAYRATNPKELRVPDDHKAD